MTISVTMTFDSVEEVIAFFGHHPMPEAGQSAPKSAPKPRAAATAPTATPPQSVAPEQKPVAAPAAPVESPPAPPAPVEAPAAPVAAPSAATVSYERVGTAIQNLVAKDRTKAVEILASLGVKRGPDLKPEQYAQALELLEQAYNALQLS